MNQKHFWHPSRCYTFKHIAHALCNTPLDEGKVSAKHKQKGHAFDVD